MPERCKRKEQIIERVRQVVSEFSGEFVVGEVQKKYNGNAGFATLSTREIVGILRGHKIAEKVPDRMKMRQAVWKKV